MEHFEMVEKLKEKANVTYEEAKDALEKCNWDILDAMIYLEKSGKTDGPEKSSYSTKTEQIIETEPVKEHKNSSFGDLLRRFGNLCRQLLVKANRNSFCVEKDGKETFRISITLLIVLLFFVFEIVIPLLIIGLFFNFRYYFVGPDMKVVDLDINKAMDTAADAAESVKHEFVNAVSKDDI